MSTVTTQLNTGSTALTVSEGGTGVATMTTAYCPVISGTTATGSLQVASTGIGTSGFILTSTGSSSLPTFQAPVIKTVSVTLTNTQFNGVFATPFEIVAAPAAGNMVVITAWQMFYVYGGTNAFTGGGTVVLQWGTTANGAGTNVMNTMPGTNFTGFAKSMSTQTAVSRSALSKASFDGLSVCLSNQSAAFTTGTNNSIICVVAYYLTATGL